MFIEETATILDDARVYGNAVIRGNAVIYGNAVINGNAWVYGRTQIHGNARVYGNARIYGNASVSGSTQIYGNAVIHGNTVIHGDARVGQGADVFRSKHVIVLSGLFQEPVTIYRTTDGSARVQAGCQNFTLDDNVMILAEGHNWELPDGWPDLIHFLRWTTRTWKDDVYDD